jgi:triacylglycerol lipase
MTRAPTRRVVALAVVLVVTTLLAGDIGAADSRQGRARRSPPRRDPVLLVHGFNGSPTNWTTMRDRLLAAGYRPREVAAMSYDSAASNVVIAQQVAAAVEQLLSRTKAKRVDLVSHSMGALSTRYYVERLGGDARVDAWVSLAGANHGTLWAYGCVVVESCRDMVPGSALLATLAPAVRPDQAVRFATWWSPCDPVIVPTEAATLAGATNIETACLSHADVTTDATVFAQVERFIRGRHRAA